MYKIFCFLCMILFTVLCFSVWSVNQFGNLEIEKLIFLLYVPLKNTPTDWMRWIWIPFFVTIYLCCWPIALQKLILKYPLRASLVFLTLLFGVAIYIEEHFFVLDYIKGNYTQSDFIEKNYTDPIKVAIEFPIKKKNLIFIQVESLETSVQDKANGGFFDMDYIPHLTQLAKDNISFSHSELIEGATVLPSTGWTIAGMVAETAGLPLKLHGKNFMTIDNSMDQYVSFLPGAVSLGDILSKNGYTNVFILGTGKEFAGQEDYLKQHGKYQIFDRDDISVEGKNQSDKAVLEFSKSKILELSKKTSPFHIMIQTYDTHLGGYNREVCPRIFEEDFKNGFSCIDSQIHDFINWIQKQKFYKDTMIIILGDHCSMSNDVAAEIEKLNNDDLSSRHNGNIIRKVYNVLINSTIQPIQKNNRQFSTMDMFPTILAGIGVKINGDRLGLGTNLFSAERTLPEKYGYDYIFQELKKKSNFYNQKLLYGR